jgi:glycine cleavage system H protein
MNIPTDLKYTDQHEWVRVEGDVATVGISDFAQEQLTDIVFVELPEVGRQVKAGEAAVVLESVKSVADVYAPLNGEVSAVNTALENKPELVNEQPYGEGWIFKLKTASADLSGLMDAAAYQGFLEKQEH